MTPLCSANRGTTFREVLAEKSCEYQQDGNLLGLNCNNTTVEKAWA